MNWKNIKKKYPKATDKLFDFLHTAKDHRESTVALYQISKLVHTERRLYDFFDEQRFYIEVFIEEDFPIRWGWRIGIFQDDRWDTDHDNGPSLNTRQKAEEQAFEKAFETLEENLNR